MNKVLEYIALAKREGGTILTGGTQVKLEGEFNIGDKIEISSLAEGDTVAVSSISKGKGFQGVVKRHGFKGGRRTHGQKHSEREPGSIGVGGVHDGPSALAKIKSGASLVQLYTSLVYEGPLVANRINNELGKLLEAEGYLSLKDAIGKDCI